VKMILNAGITTIYYLEGYPDDLATRLLEESGIIIEQIQ
jgi:deoxycytidylate deaminase